MSLRWNSRKTSFLPFFILGNWINSPESQPCHSPPSLAFNHAACLCTASTATTTAFAKQIMSYTIRKQENDVSLMWKSDWFKHNLSWCVNVLCQLVKQLNMKYTRAEPSSCRGTQDRKSCPLLYFFLMVQSESVWWAIVNLGLVSIYTSAPFSSKDRCLFFNPKINLYNCWNIYLLGI